MDRLKQLAWVADAIKSPLASPPPTRPASLAVLADEPPLDVEHHSDLAPTNTANGSTDNAIRTTILRRRNLSRAAERHGVSGLLSAEAHARALVVLHLESHAAERESAIRDACPGPDIAEQLRSLVATGAVKRTGHGVNGDPYRYALTSMGIAMVIHARAALAMDAAAQEELSRAVAAAAPRKPAKIEAPQAENEEEEVLPSKRKRKVTEALKENYWNIEEEEAKPAPHKPRSTNPATGFAAIYRALSRIKSRKRTARASPPDPAENAARARVRRLAPPPASAALTWDGHWARKWGSYEDSPRRERRAVGDVLISIADADGAAVTGSELRRIFPGCPDHSKALTTVINAGWATREGAGGRYDPFRYTVTAAGLAAAAAARSAMAADNAVGRSNESTE